MLIMTVALILLAVTACSPEHEHTFSAWETVSAPTCTAFGLEKRSCECGAVEYGKTDALSHTPVTDEAVSATCTENGKTEGSHCGVCGIVITKQTETEKLAHGFGDWETVTAPTCTSFGLKKRACECGATEYDTFDALAHTPLTDAAIPATCTSSGKTEGSHCGTCGVIITAQDTVPKTGHYFGEITVTEEAVCNSDGTKRFSCTNLGCSYYYEDSYSLSALDSSEIYAEAAQYTGTLQIFDRFGKKLCDMKAADMDAWDGTYNGRDLPSTDYWYEIQIDEIDKTYIGHFTLIRN
jgi:gliding motility-associated-like protein